MNVAPTRADPCPRLRTAVDVRRASPCSERSELLLNTRIARNTAGLWRERWSGALRMPILGRSGVGCRWTSIRVTRHCACPVRHLTESHSVLARHCAVSRDTTPGRSTASGALDYPDMLTSCGAARRRWRLLGSPIFYSDRLHELRESLTLTAQVTALRRTMGWTRRLNVGCGRHASPLPLV